MSPAVRRIDVVKTEQHGVPSQLPSQEQHNYRVPQPEAKTEWEIFDAVSIVYFEAPDSHERHYDELLHCSTPGDDSVHRPQQRTATSQWCHQQPFLLEALRSLRENTGSRINRTAEEAGNLRRIPAASPPLGRILAAIRGAKVPDCRSGGCGFESRRGRLKRRLIQPSFFLRWFLPSTTNM